MGKSIDNFNAMRYLDNLACKLSSLRKRFTCSRQHTCLTKEISLRGLKIRGDLYENCLNVFSRILKNRHPRKFHRTLDSPEK